MKDIVAFLPFVYLSLLFVEKNGVGFILKLNSLKTLKPIYP